MVFILGMIALRSLVQQVAEPFRAFEPEVTLSCCSMLLLWPQDHDHLAALQLRPLLDNADFDALAQACIDHSRYEFMLTISPLVVLGGTGSPVNPIALF